MSHLDGCPPLTSEAVTTPYLDACLELIADRRRRRIIDQLRNNGRGRTTISDLAGQLERDEHAGGTDRPRDKEELEIQLYHTYLPKLDEFGVVDYDIERGTVQYRPSEQLEAVVHSLPEEVPRPDP